MEFIVRRVTILARHPTAYYGLNDRVDNWIIICSCRKSFLFLKFDLTFSTQKYIKLDTCYVYEWVKIS